MNKYNFSELNDCEQLGAFEGMIKTPEQADSIISGYICNNKGKTACLANFLERISDLVPTKKWFDYFFHCCCYATSCSKFKVAVDRAKELVKSSKSKKLSETNFIEIENLYLTNNEIFKDEGLLKKAAKMAYKRSSDSRYKLFCDYAYVYVSNDFDELIGALIYLSMNIKTCNRIEDKRYIFYVQCLTLARIIRIEGFESVNENLIESLYSKCILYCREYSSFDSDIMHKCYPSRRFNLFRKITEYNCFEVARIFESLGLRLGSGFTHKLCEAVMFAKEGDRYSSEKKQLLAQKSVFLSNSMPKPELSPFDSRQFLLSDTPKSKKLCRTNLSLLPEVKGNKTHPGVIETDFIDIR